jgi:PAS domain-containing protein
VRQSSSFHQPLVADSSEAHLPSGLIRVLVLNDDDDLASQIENALWMWPHKVSLVASAESAIALCQHLTPAAILAAADRDRKAAVRAISTLRRRLPAVPIVAVVSRKQSASPGSFLDHGADALLLRDDAHRPTLYDLLVSVQRSDSASATSMRAAPIELALPWRQSGMLGALICDVTGEIVDANGSLASWLDYSPCSEMRGRNVRRELLVNREDWAAWVDVAGDTRGLLQQQASIATRNGQIRWMQVEIFAAPRHPSHLQAVFVDQTELAMLSGRAR